MSVTTTLVFAISDKNIRQDNFGRIVFDSCPSDGAHLRDAKEDPEAGRPTCRSLLEEKFKQFVGLRGTMVVSISFVPTEVSYGA